MTNKNNTTSKATETKAAETVYTIAARAASAFGRSVTSKALAAAGMDTKEARAAFMAYKDNATALISKGTHQRGKPFHGLLCRR